MQAWNRSLQEAQQRGEEGDSGREEAAGVEESPMQLDVSISQQQHEMLKLQRARVEKQREEVQHKEEERRVEWEQEEEAQRVLE